MAEHKLYKIVGAPGDYQVMEQFGDYRLSRKRFKTIEKALAHIEKLGGKVNASKHRQN